MSGKGSEKEKGGSEKTESDKGGSDKAGSDKGGSDKAGSDKGGSDKGGSDKGGSDKGGSEKGGSEKGATSDTTGGSEITGGGSEKGSSNTTKVIKVETTEGSEGSLLVKESLPVLKESGDGVDFFKWSLSILNFYHRKLIMQFLNPLQSLVQPQRAKEMELKARFELTKVQGRMEAYKLRRKALPSAAHSLSKRAVCWRLNRSAKANERFLIWGKQTTAFLAKNKRPSFAKIGIAEAMKQMHQYVHAMGYIWGFTTAPPPKLQNFVGLGEEGSGRTAKTLKSTSKPGAKTPKGKGADKSMMSKAVGGKGGKKKGGGGGAPIQPAPSHKPSSEPEKSKAMTQATEGKSVMRKAAGGSPSSASSGFFQTPLAGGKETEEEENAEEEEEDSLPVPTDPEEGPGSAKDLQYIRMLEGKAFYHRRAVAGLLQSLEEMLSAMAVRYPPSQTEGFPALPKDVRAVLTKLPPNYPEQTLSVFPQMPPNVQEFLLTS